MSQAPLAKGGAKALREQLRQGSENRIMANRFTPDGKELVECVPLEWAVEVMASAQREARIDELKKADNRFTNPYLGKDKFQAYMQERIDALVKEPEGSDG